MNKLQLRQIMRPKRQSLTSKQIDQYSKAVFANIIQANLCRGKNHIGCYLAFDNEVSTYKLIEYLQQQSICCYVPVLCKNNKLTMQFYPYRQNQPYIKNRYGILEPDIQQLQPVSIDTLELIFLPLLGFDSTGNRLGMGQGYYDRLLAQHKNLHACQLIGLAYAFQQCEEIPAEKWDIRLNQVITDKAIFAF